MIPSGRYPKPFSLRDGTNLVLRPMAPGDADALWEFFRIIPEEDRIYFRDDVDTREVIRHWSENIDYSAVLPILAFEGDRVVADATLHRQKRGWKQRIGFLRIQIAPDFRHRGLGTAMVRELRHLGEKVALRHLVAEVIEEQQSAIRAFEKLGFERAIVYRDFVNDRKGNLHNLVVLLYTMIDPSEGGVDEE